MSQTATPSRHATDLAKYVKSLMNMPNELRGLACEDEFSCGATGDDWSLCPPCRQRQEWIEVRRKLDDGLSRELAEERIAWDAAKADAIFEARERLAPMLRDLNVLFAVFPEQVRELLAEPGADIFRAVQEAKP